MTISGVTLDHDAEFTCLAKNNAGEAKSSAQLVIDSGEGTNHHRILSSVFMSAIVA